MSAFEELRDRIADGHDRLGHTLGWRFLATSAETLSPDTSLAFVGLNPGGRVYEPPVASVETGNAYRIERWGARGGPNALQVQVGRLYAQLAAKLDEPPERLMDATLTANFCPFRSPSWESLVNPADSVAFSRALWTDLLSIARPRAVVCLGGETASQLGAVLQRRGMTLSRPVKSCPAAWGAVTVGLAPYQDSNGQTLLVRLPHLSRFGIFGRDKSQPAIDQLIDAIAGAARNEASDQEPYARR